MLMVRQLAAQQPGVPYAPRAEGAEEVFRPDLAVSRRYATVEAVRAYLARVNTGE